MGMRALLIEDDSAVANSIELMLKSAGLNLYTTDLGEEGIDLGKIYDYDIIVLDRAHQSRQDTRPGRHDHGAGGGAAGHPDRG